LFAIAEQVKMATFYAYNVPTGMNKHDFEKMLGSETVGEVRIASISSQDNEAMLTFRDPGYLHRIIPIPVTE